MESKPVILACIFAQLWWALLSAEIKGPANSPMPTTLLITNTIAGGPGNKLPTYSYRTNNPEDFAKHAWGKPTTQTQVPKAEDLEPHDGHFITAVIIGVILIVMITIIVAIFLWRRWKKLALPPAHWAGRSPFADGDVPDVPSDKGPTQGTKRASVLSLLPWRFNKDEQLLESAGTLGTLPRRGTERRQSSPTATASSTSLQTAVSEGLNSLIDVPFQPDDPELIPPPPPPPNWLGEANGDLCLKQTESHPPEPNAEIQGSSDLLDLSQQILEEGPALPPPPEDLLI